MVAQITHVLHGIAWPLSRHTLGWGARHSEGDAISDLAAMQTLTLTIVTTEFAALHKLVYGAGLSLAADNRQQCKMGLCTITHSIM